MFCHNFLPVIDESRMTVDTVLETALSNSGLSLPMTMEAFRSDELFLNKAKAMVYTKTYNHMFSVFISNSNTVFGESVEKFLINTLWSSMFTAPRAYITRTRFPNKYIRVWECLINMYNKKFESYKGVIWAYLQHNTRKVVIDYTKEENATDRFPVASEFVVTPESARHWEAAFLPYKHIINRYNEVLPIKISGGTFKETLNFFNELEDITSEQANNE